MNKFIMFLIIGAFVVQVGYIFKGGVGGVLKGGYFQTS